MNTLQFASDIHLEMRKTIPIIKPVKDKNVYLCLCGDIGNPYLENYEKFLKIHSELFTHILIISGNHEYYSVRNIVSIGETDAMIEKIVSKYKNITYLNKSGLIIDGVKFIGCTLWSDVSSIPDIAEKVMNDYKYIYVKKNKKNNKKNKNQDKSQNSSDEKYKRLLKASDVCEMNKECIEWIKHEINKFKETDKYKKIIILTHHAPSFSMLNKSDVYSPCYATNYNDIMGKPVSIWISGHSHHSNHIRINNTLCVSNCMGYPGEKVNYDARKYIPF